MRDGSAQERAQCSSLSHRCRAEGKPCNCFRGPRPLTGDGILAGYTQEYKIQETLFNVGLHYTETLAQYPTINKT